MKIGFLVPTIHMSLEHYGNEIFAPRDLAIEMVDSLVERGHNVTFFTTSDIDTKARLISGDMNLMPGRLFMDRVFSKDKSRKKWGTFYNLKREFEIDLTLKAFLYAEKNKLDIIHVYIDDYSHYFDEITNTPCVYTLHDPLPSIGSIEYWRLMRFKNHNYISISDNQRGNYDLNFIKTIYHGLDLKDFLYNDNPADYYAFIGRPIKEKGLDIAIRVAEKLHRKIKLAYKKDAKLKNSQYYNNRIVPILNGLVKEIGLLRGNEKSDFYAKAKAFLFPIEWEEPFGLVMIEAMACGTPVIAYGRGSVPEIVKDGETGFIVNHSNKDRRGDWIIKKSGFEGLLEAVRKLDNMSDTEYKTMRLNCRKHVEKNFTIDKMVSNHEDLYKKIIEHEKTKK